MCTNLLYSQVAGSPLDGPSATPALATPPPPQSATTAAPGGTEGGPGAAEEQLDAAAPLRGVADAIVRKTETHCLILDGFSRLIGVRQTG